MYYIGGSRPVLRKTGLGILGWSSGLFAAWVLWLICGLGFRVQGLGISGLHPIIFYLGELLYHGVQGSCRVLVASRRKSKFKSLGLSSVLALACSRMYKLTWFPMPVLLFLAYAIAPLIFNTPFAHPQILNVPCTTKDLTHTHAHLYTNMYTLCMCT